MIDQKIKKHRSGNARRSMILHRYEKCKERVKELIFNKYFYVAKSDKERFLLSSGIGSRFYFDTRHMLLDWSHTQEVAGLMRYKILIDLVDDNPKDLEMQDLMIGGLETGAILVTMSIINKMALSGFYVRKEGKQHGNDKYIVTPKNLNDKHLIIIDDILTSGKSMYRALGTVNMVFPNAKIWKVYSLIDRSKELGFYDQKFYMVPELNCSSIYESQKDFINLLDNYNSEIK